MDSGVIVTSMGIGAAIFAGLIIFWFFHTFIKRKLGAEKSVQLPISSQKFNGEELVERYQSGGGICHLPRADSAK